MKSKWEFWVQQDLQLNHLQWLLCHYATYNNHTPWQNALITLSSFHTTLKMFETKSRFFRKLMEGLRCIDEFTLKCLDREHRAYFNTLYAGTTQVIIDLCKEGEYQKGQLNSLYISIGGKNFLNQNTISTFKCNV